MCMRTFSILLAVIACVSTLQAAAVRPVRVFERITRVEQLQQKQSVRLSIGLWNEASRPSLPCRRAGFNTWFIGGETLDDRILQDAYIQALASAVIPVYTGPDLSADRSKQWFAAQSVSAGGNAFFGDLWSPRLPPVVSQRWNEFLRSNQTILNNAMVMAVFMSPEDGSSLPLSTTIAAQPEHLAGFWAGGEVALSAFRNAMRQRYTDIQILNAQWGTQYTDWESVQYPSPSEAGWPVFVGWYQNGLSYALQVHLQSARRQHSTLPLLLPVGGASADRRRGVDLSAQVRSASRNQASAIYMGYVKGAQCPYPDLELALTSSAAAHFGTSLWLGPPADALNPDLRLFRALSEGCVGLWERQASAAPLSESAMRLGKYLQWGSPVRSVSVLYPTTDYRAFGSTALGDVDRLLRLVREHAACGVLDERMIQDGGLAHQRLLVAGDIQSVEPATRSKITEWVRQGGVLLTFAGASSRLVDNPPAVPSNMMRPRFIARMSGTTYAIQPGIEGYRLLLAGNWGDATATGGRRVQNGAIVKLPLQANKRYELAVELDMPNDPTIRVELTGDQSPLGQADTAGRNTYRYFIPATGTPRIYALQVNLSEGTKTDAAIVMHRVTIREVDAAVQIEGSPGQYQLNGDWTSLTANWTNQMGDGWLVRLPAGGTPECINLLGRVASVLMRTPQKAGIQKVLAPILTTHAPGIEVGLLPDRLLLMNHGRTEADVTVTVDKPVLETFGVHAAASGRATVRVPAGSCVVRSLGLPDVDIYLQCERFTVPGAARAVPATGFAPGPGVNALRLTSKSVSRTAFQAPRAGTYRVFLRSISQGMLTPLEISVNGRKVTQKATPYVDPLDTLYLGDATLVKGVNTLELRNMSGREVTADFVILTSRPDVAGFTLSTRPSDR